MKKFDIFSPFPITSISWARRAKYVYDLNIKAHGLSHSLIRGGGKSGEIYAKFAMYNEDLMNEKCFSMAPLYQNIKFQIH